VFQKKDRDSRFEIDPVTSWGLSIATGAATVEP